MRILIVIFCFLGMGFTSSPGTVSEPTKVELSFCGGGEATHHTTTVDGLQFLVVQVTTDACPVTIEAPTRRPMIPSKFSQEYQFGPYEIGDVVTLELVCNSGNCTGTYSETITIE